MLQNTFVEMCYRIVTSYVEMCYNFFGYVLQTIFLDTCYRCGDVLRNTGYEMCSRLLLPIIPAEISGCAKAEFSTG